MRATVCYPERLVQAGALRADQSMKRMEQIMSKSYISSDETIEYVGILAKLELSGEEKEAAKEGHGEDAGLY